VAPAIAFLLQTRAVTPLPPRPGPTSLQFSAGFRDEFAAVAGFALWPCVQETNLARDDFPVGVLPILSVGAIADGASPRDVHSHIPPLIRTNRLCKSFTHLHAMPLRLLVPFPQGISVRFIYSDREVGYDAAVLRVSYRRISAKTPRYVDSIESAPSPVFGHLL
jgi:hypothetical protein